MIDNIKTMGEINLLGELASWFQDKKVEVDSETMANIYMLLATKPARENLCEHPFCCSKPVSKEHK